MQGSWLDSLPSNERQKIRQRMRSPAAYERLRESVKGPEDLEKEMRRSEQLAELHFALETEPATQERLRSSIHEDVAEQGLDAILDAQDATPEARNAVEQGKFTVAVQPNATTHEDALHALPEGNVQERLPVKTSMSQRYIGQGLMGSGMNAKS